MQSAVSSILHAEWRHFGPKSGGILIPFPIIIPLPHRLAASNRAIQVWARCGVCALSALYGHRNWIWCIFAVKSGIDVCVWYSPELSIANVTKVKLRHYLFCCKKCGHAYPSNYCKYVSYVRNVTSILRACTAVWLMGAVISVDKTFMIYTTHFANRSRFSLPHYHLVSNMSLHHLHHHHSHLLSLLYSFNPGWRPTCSTIVHSRHRLFITYRTDFLDSLTL